MIETVQVNGKWLNEVQYNTKTKDLTLWFTGGQKFLYVDVPEKIFTSLKELETAKISPEELEKYIQNSMTKVKRGQYVGRGVYLPKREDKYIGIKLSEDIDAEAQELAVEYATKKGKTLVVEEKYSSNVAKVRYDNKALYMTYRSGNTEYVYEDTPSVVKSLFEKFVDSYLKIKKGGDTARTEHSLGKLANFVKKQYSDK